VAVSSTAKRIIGAFNKCKSKDRIGVGGTDQCPGSQLTSALGHSVAYELYAMITGRTTSLRNCAE
jgi:hypothetical protein